MFYLIAELTEDIALRAPLRARCHHALNLQQKALRGGGPVDSFLKDDSKEHKKGTHP